jgi:hypothetical protein
MKTAQQTAQQGDVIFRKLPAMPPGVILGTDKARLVLAHGESGHSHVLEDDEAALIKIGDMMLLQLEREATVKHDEHGPAQLSPGIWEVGRVREFDYFLMMERTVID